MGLVLKNLWNNESNKHGNKSILNYLSDATARKALLNVLSVVTPDVNKCRYIFRMIPKSMQCILSYDKSNASYLGNMGAKKLMISRGLYKNV